MPTIAGIATALLRNGIRPLVSVDPTTDGIRLRERRPGIVNVYVDVKNSAEAENLSLKVWDALTREGYVLCGNSRYAMFTIISKGGQGQKNRRLSTGGGRRIGN